MSPKRLTAFLAPACAAFALAACAAPGPVEGPVGIAAEDLPPQTAGPEGVLGDARVGADSLADPEIDTLGDPFL